MKDVVQGKSLKFLQIVICLASLTMQIKEKSAFAQTPSAQIQTVHCGKASVVSLYFGDTILPGNDSTQCITVKNCGDAIEVFTATTGSGEYIVTPKVSTPLPPDSSFTFCVGFHPITSGNKSSYLFINFGSSRLPYIPLSGSTPCAH